MLNNFRRGPESAGFSRQIESSVGEEPVPAPINTASDALRELVDDEGGAQQLGVDASRDAVDSRSKQPRQKHDAGVHK